MAQGAEEQGLDRTPQFLSQERRLREELLIRLLGEKQAEAIKAPNPQAIDKFIAENPRNVPKSSAVIRSTNWCSIGRPT